VSGTSLGSAVLELSTNQAPLRQGLTEARAETIRQTEAMRNAARIELRANLLRLQADYQQAQRLARETAQRAPSESQFELRANLAKFQSDLRQAERLQASRCADAPAGEPGGRGLLGDIGRARSPASASVARRPRRGSRPPPRSARSRLASTGW
jgi:ABC-type transporter Mla subunit MlaD